MKLPELALPDKSLWGTLRYSRARNEYEGNDGDNDERNANGEDEQEVSGDEFMFGKWISLNDVSILDNYQEMRTSYVRDIRVNKREWSFRRRNSIEPTSDTNKDKADNPVEEVGQDQSNGEVTASQTTR